MTQAILKNHFLIKAAEKWLAGIRKFITGWGAVAEKAKAIYYAKKFNENRNTQGLQHHEMGKLHKNGFIMMCPAERKR